MSLPTSPVAQDTTPTPTTLRLEAEFIRLLEEEHQAIEAAAEGQRTGDINENTDVALALANLSRVRARMHQIKSALANPASGEVAPVGTVSVGRIVELRFDDEDPETYLFGSVEDRHALFTTLTESSPVGREIAGATAGSTINVEMGAKVHQVEIVSVREDG